MTSVTVLIRRLVIILSLLLPLAVSESALASPVITLEGSPNLWNQTALGEWVWNPPGDPWPIGYAASDPSGVCMLVLTAGGHEYISPNSFPYDYTGPCPTVLTWTPSQGATVDTQAMVVGAGPLQIAPGAIDAVHLATGDAVTVEVDNDPVRVSLKAVDDPDPMVWVNHAVTVDTTPIAGPSGAVLTGCRIDGLAAHPSPAHIVTVDGDGVHLVSCTASNNAVDPQGLHKTGNGSLAVYIDEAPPSIRFESRTAQDPTELVVDTTDDEAGVAGGAIQLAPAGTNDWATLATSFDGAHLTAQLDDRRREGSYVVRASSCDQAGNCASTAQALTFPLRIVPNFEVSLTRIVDPTRRHAVYKRVLVGWHWVTLRRDGRSVRVKRGGHLTTIRIVEIVQQCTLTHVRVGPHRWHVKRNCKTPHPHLTATLSVAHGHSVTIHGLVTTPQGVPLPGQSVGISTALDNYMDVFRDVSTVTTAPDGRWTATLPPGPSRIIRAVTDGTATVLPASGQVTAIVPADIKLLKVWPRHVAWGGTVHLVGQLFGGHLPPGGALVRLRIGYGSTYNTYGVKEHVAGDGRFSTVASFGPGDPSILRTYWFQIASLPMGNYPYAPAASQRVPVIVGGDPSRAAAAHDHYR
jgi:hypothetical protein